MPAKDRYHDAVKQALIKDGWTILDEQITLVLGERYLFVDIEAEQLEMGQIILVEVKELEEVDSPVEALANAVGMYFLYRMVLDLDENIIPIYLAVSDAAFRGILAEPMGIHAIERAHIPMLVFNPEEEVIVRWIHLDKQ
jgi:hypothetical protein